MTLQRVVAEEKVFPIHHAGFPGFDAIHLASHHTIPYIILSIKQTPANDAYLASHCRELQKIATHARVGDQIYFQFNGMSAMRAAIQLFLAQGLYGLDQNHNLISLLKMISAQFSPSVATAEPAMLPSLHPSSLVSDSTTQTVIPQRKVTQCVSTLFHSNKKPISAQTSPVNSPRNPNASTSR